MDGFLESLVKYVVKLKILTLIMMTIQSLLKLNGYVGFAIENTMLKRNLLKLNFNLKGFKL